MVDPERLLGQVLGNSLGGGMGYRKKKKRKHQAYGLGSFGGLSTSAKAQLGVGLIGIAMAAWEHYKQKPMAPANHAAIPPPPPMAPPPLPPGAATVQPPTKPHGDPMRGAVVPEGAFATPEEARRHDDAILLLRAMIAAAHADGRLDEDEREAILSSAREAGLDADDVRFLEAELATPRTLEQIVDETRGALREQIYTVSLVAITVDTDEERAYLDRLAGALRLSEDERRTIHARLEDAV